MKLAVKKGGSGVKRKADEIEEGEIVEEGSNKKPALQHGEDSMGESSVEEGSDSDDGGKYDKELLHRVCCRCALSALCAAGVVLSLLSFCCYFCCVLGWCWCCCCYNTGVFISARNI